MFIYYYRLLENATGICAVWLPDWLWLDRLWLDRLWLDPLWLGALTARYRLFPCVMAGSSVMAGRQSRPSALRRRRWMAGTRLMDTQTTSFWGSQADGC